MKRSRPTLAGKFLLTHFLTLRAVIGSLISRLTELFIAHRWSSGVILELLNAPTTDLRNSLAKAFMTSTLSGLKNVGLTAGLVAGVISSAFSWTTLTQSHWLTFAFWYAGLIFAFASISSAGLCTNALLRLRWHVDSGDRVRDVLGYPVPASLSGSAVLSGDEKWVPRACQPWVWGAPGVLLKFSLLAFLVGLGVHVWFLALESLGAKGWGSEEMKIAVFVTVAAASAAGMYLVAVFWLFYRTVRY